ncbi:hypothetical protein QN386_21405 [Pseudomonas sp. CCI3.2]|uniref:hypothetical protein n=1 Tax=unclassified Pseudomonas TaxID=196821 RepID=UPI002AC9807E|nr:MULTISPECIES: hypothetical protein [unclassified Pseudomonas]MEB0075563.1 hypothetical protein [Pseudomonas sp. MH10out]MEB0103863.1 hypothetical protein [Pseudomonas sp. CCI3.2]MEB0130402.1 hypothetical protein [Pseudomonas sp. CCI2.4]MEB0159426.1 hypothetical protein [Pseudomonas sp. AH2 (2023)]MEB0170172.1 hypothetical protein [Pseudomonas sp. CCC4.4]
MSMPVSSNIPTFIIPTTVTRGDQPSYESVTQIPSGQNSSSDDTASVTLSPEAQGLYRQEQSAVKTPRSKAELQAIWHRNHGASSWKVGFINQVNSQGQTSPLLMQKPLDTSPERQAQAEQVASFLFISHTTRTEIGNPYDSLSREELCDILYDETGNHTPAERYLASRTQQRKDFEYMTRNSNRDGIPYKAIIAFCDAQSDVERSMYPDGDREQLLRFLKEAEDNGYPNTEEATWDPWMSKYFQKPNANSPVAERTLIQTLSAKTTESAPSGVDTSA